MREEAYVRLDVFRTNVLQGRDGRTGKTTGCNAFAGRFILRRTAAASTRTAANTEILRIIMRDPQDLDLTEGCPDCNGMAEEAESTGGHVHGRAPPERTGKPRPATGPLDVQCVSCPATAGSVFRPSTSPEVAHIFARLEQRLRRSLLQFCEPAVRVFDFSLHPADTRDRNLALLTDQNQVGTFVSRKRSTPIAIGIVEQCGECDAVLFQECCGVAAVVL